MIFSILVGIPLIIQEEVIMRWQHLILKLFVAVLVGINIQACGSMQQMLQGTPTSTPTITLTPSPTLTATSTLTPTKTLTPTVTPNLTATQQYIDFTSLVQKFHEAGHISTAEGTYTRVEDFSDELAMGYGYRWTPTGVDTRDFIIRAEFDWEVANQKNYSGCGYVFRQTSDDHYYMIALDALNGVLLFYTKLGLDQFGHPTTVHTAIRAVKKEKLPDMGNNPYHAEVTLIVNEYNAYIYVNGAFYSEHRLQKDRLTDPGTLSYLVLTGSGTDYGTRCKITNTDAWIFSS